MHRHLGKITMSASKDIDLGDSQQFSFGQLWNH